jgi:mannose-6-phosphate isomerase-like protein (cupin superfamily)
MPLVRFINGLADVLVDGEYTLIDQLLPPGDQPPLHVHDADEGFLVLEGELTLWAGDARHVLGPGDFVNAPAGVPHTYRVTSAGRARLIVTSSTGAFAAFVLAYGEPAARRELPEPAAPDAERLGRLAAKHGIALLGPPGMLPADLSPAR